MDKRVEVRLGFIYIVICNIFPMNQMKLDRTSVSWHWSVVFMFMQTEWVMGSISILLIGSLKIYILIGTNIKSLVNHGLTPRTWLCTYQPSESQLIGQFSTSQRNRHLPIAVHYTNTCPCSFVEVGPIHRLRIYNAV